MSQVTGLQNQVDCNAIHGKEGLGLERQSKRLDLLLGCEVSLRIQNEGVDEAFRNSILEQRKEVEVGDIHL